ncbi:hypothetical protein [Anaerotignum sp.]|nr:hypothetical protein [Anaerotignum sp.]
MSPLFNLTKDKKVHLIICVALVVYAAILMLYSMLILYDCGTLSAKAVTG